MTSFLLLEFNRSFSSFEEEEYPPLGLPLTDNRFTIVPMKDPSRLPFLSKESPLLQSLFATSLHFNSN